MKSLPLLAIAASLTACGGAHTTGQTAAQPTLVVEPLARKVADKRAADAALQPANSHLVANIERKAIGPFLAMSEQGGLVAWIAAKERGGGAELEVVPLDRDGAPLAAPKVVADVPQDATALVVRAAGGSHGGFLLAWSALLDRGESLSILGLAPDGVARAPAADVQRTSDHVKWFDMVPTPHGAVCVWAEETAAGGANLLTSSIDADGKPRGMPARVARGVEGWAATPVEDGAALALVTPTAGTGAGLLSWQRLDAQGRPLGAPLPIGSQPTVNSDVDVTPVAGGWLLAWTDRTGEDPQVMLASVDAESHVRGPRRAMDMVGGASLVALATSPAGTALAWEEPRGRDRPFRPLHLASVSMDPDLVAQPMTSVQIAAQGAPELSPTATGFALLVPAHACRKEEGSACAGPVIPTLVRLDARLTPVQSEPFYVGDFLREGTLGWGLSCGSRRCTALATTADAPTPVFTVDVPERASPFADPTTPVLPVDAPRVTGVATLASGLPFTDLAAARLSDRTLVVTLANADEDASPRRRRPRGATISARMYDDQGRPLEAPALLTSRALAVGGVAVAPGGSPDDGAIVAWVARDGGDPQVHVGHVDRRGHRTNESQLTTSKGDASDVSVAWAGDGWLVAWVDTRDGNGEVYATKVDRDLQRTAHEERITRAMGDAGDLALTVRRDVALIAFSDSRESPREGLSDIYTATLSTRDAKRLGAETRVLSTAAHSRSPALSAAGDGEILVWIEDSPSEIDAPGRAMLARLDETGRLAAPPVQLPLAAEGRPMALGLAAGREGETRVFVARSARDEITLDAVAVPREGASFKPWTLLDLDAPATFEVTLATAGDAVFYADVGSAPADHRIRRASVAWRR